MSRIDLEFNTAQMRDAVLNDMHRAMRPFLAKLAEIETLETMLRSPLLRSSQQQQERGISVESIPKKRPYSKRRTAAEPPPPQPVDYSNPDSIVQNGTIRQAVIQLLREFPQLTVPEMSFHMKAKGRTFGNKPSSSIWPILASAERHGEIKRLKRIPGQPILFMLGTDLPPGPQKPHDGQNPPPDPPHDSQDAPPQKPHDGQNNDPESAKSPPDRSSRSDVILDLMQRAKRPMTTDQIVQGLISEGYKFSRGESAVRSVGHHISGLVHRNQAKKVRASKPRKWIARD